jgi:hypothetical protein
MERKLITCPDTAQLEEIEYEQSPLGILITGCSRFQPRSCVTCDRECARRMNRRDRLDDQLDFDERDTLRSPAIVEGDL